MKNLDILVLLLILAFCWAFSLVSFGKFMEHHEEERMMNEAVKNGHARYYIDKDNKRAFEWLPRCGAH